MISLYLLVLLCSISGGSTEDYRAKRQINSIPLVYPYGAIYKLIIGMSVPVPNDDKIPLLFALNFQYQYNQFQNITELSQYYFIKEVSREERDLDLENRGNERLVFYKSVADLMDIKGMNGQECVLRAICEAAQFPVAEEALVGEVLHILLTPDYGRAAFDKDPDIRGASMSEYLDAAVAGRQMFDCAAIYSGCAEGQGLLDLVTMLRDE